VGIGVINGTNGSVGPQVVTEDFGDPGDVRYITGVVYEDLNSNNFYDIGEGRPGVRIDVNGSGYYAISAASGGYSVPVSQDDSYAVSFSGGGFESFMTTAVVANGENEKVDYLVSELETLLGDFNADGKVDAADYVALTKGFGTTYGEWRTHFGEADSGGSGPPALMSDQPGVPEPATLALASLAAFAIAAQFARNRQRVELSLVV
jgi:hypothetical protein